MRSRPPSSGGTTRTAASRRSMLSCTRSAPTALALPRSSMPRPHATGRWRRPIARLPSGSMLPSTRSAPCSRRTSAEGAMAQINVTINGRQFRMACENGEEARLTRLADELSEVKERLRRLEPELATLQEASVVSADRAQATQAAVVAALNAAAERIESLTRQLNQTVVDAGVPMG